MIQAWLNVMCLVLPRVQAATVARSNTPSSEGHQLLAVWPAGSEPSEELLTTFPIGDHPPAFTTLVRNDGTKIFRLARSLTFGSDKEISVIVELEAEPGQQTVIFQLVEWGERWLELLKTGADLTKAMHTDAIGELLAAADLNAGLTAIATYLAQVYQLDRVFIGRGQPGAIKVCAISHNVRFDGRSSLIRDLERTLEETVTAQCPITDVDPEYPGIADLRNSQNMKPLIAIPLSGSDLRTVAAMLIENEASVDFSHEQIAAFSSFAKLIKFAIQLREQAGQSILDRAMWTIKGYFKNILGPRFLPFKIASTALIAVLAMLSVFDGSYEVVASATLEGRLQRAIVAPFAGYVKEQNARAGDSVTKGQIVAELDSRELEVEQQRLESARNEIEKQYSQSLAAMDRADVRIFASQVAQIDAQLDLVEIKLARTQLAAPMSGIIIRGDLSRSLGAAVERGDILYEVAPLDDYRLAIEVPENRITTVKSGQTGYLVLDAFPDRQHEFRVEQIAGATEESTGAITFRVVAAISENDIDKLRPGMTGTARVNTGERPLLWILSHEIVDWVMLTWWRLLP